MTYEARDIDQRISSPKNIDEWFEVTTQDLNDYEKRALKQKWGTMQKVSSSRPRIQKIVEDVLMDFKKNSPIKFPNGKRSYCGSIHL